MAAGLGSENDKNVQDSLDSFKLKIEDFEKRLKRTSDENSQLLQTLLEAVKESRNNNQIQHISDSEIRKSEEKLDEIGQKSVENHEDLVQKSSTSLVIAVLMFACNRVTVSKALDSLLSYRKDKAKFPIIGMIKFELKLEPKYFVFIIF